MFNFTALAVLVASSLVSSLGSIALKHAALTGNPALAILAASLWASSAAGFVWLSDDSDLSVLSIITSALGIFIVQAAAVGLFGEAITARKVISLALLIAAIAVLSVPSGRS